MIQRRSLPPITRVPAVAQSFRHAFRQSLPVEVLEPVEREANVTLATVSALDPRWNDLATDARRFLSAYAAAFLAVTIYFA